MLNGPLLLTYHCHSTLPTFNFTRKRGAMENFEIQYSNFFQ